MPFDFNTIPDVPLSGGGFFPRQQRLMDPRAAAQAAWLNRGGQQLPAGAMATPNTDQWTDEDWQIAVMSGADPMGVREAFERIKGVDDERAFMEGLGKIDWRNPQSKSQVSNLITQFPRGVTQKGIGLMQMLDKLEEPDKDPYRPQVAELGTDYLNAYDAAIKGGADKETAMAQAASLRQKNVAAEKGRQDLRVKFVEAGGDVDAFDELASKPGADWATLRDYLNKNPPKKSSGRAWTERVTDKTAEVIRQIARGAKSGTFEDFEDEFTEQTSKEDAPFKGTRDDYVRQFKGDADFNAYKQRRLVETGQSLVDDYGLFPEEAGQVLGLRGPAAASQSRSAASLAPQAPTSAPVETNAVAPTQEGPVAAPVNPVPAQPSTSPQQRDTGFNFPTLGDDLPPTAFESTVQAGRTAASNLASNVAFDPLAALGAATSPGGIAAMAVKAAPTNQEQQQAWTEAKQTVRDYINGLPGDDAQKLKMMGSILAEQDVPMDSFFPKKVGSKDRIHAGIAIESGLKLFGKNKELPEHALQDKEGKRRWAEVAKIVAQEEMAKRGLISSPNAPAPSGVAPSGAKWTVKPK